MGLLEGVGVAAVGIPEGLEVGVSVGSRVAPGIVGMLDGMGVVIVGLPEGLGVGSPVAPAGMDVLGDADGLSIGGKVVGLAVGTCDGP